MHDGDTQTGTGAGDALGAGRVGGKCGCGFRLGRIDRRVRGCVDKEVGRRSGDAAFHAGAVEQVKDRALQRDQRRWRAARGLDQ